MRKTEAARKHSHQRNLLRLSTPSKNRSHVEVSSDVGTVLPRTKLGAPVAIKAMAAKLARLVYRMLRYGMKYVDQGAQFYEAQHRKRQISHLKWKAAKLGFQIVEAAAA
jgi:transposase